MKVLFINLSTERIYNAPESRPILEPLWAEYLAAALLEHDVKIMDLNLSHFHWRQKIKDFNPDFIGISVATPQVKEARRMIKALRQIAPSNKIILGGPHISANGRINIDHDIKISGEGEDSIKSMLEKRTSTYEKLDDLPFPIRLPRVYELKYDFGNKQVLASMITSRGCPYRCIFCASKKTFGSKPRFRSPENVIAELKELKERHKVNSIIFLDDCFSLNKERVKKLCALMIEENLNVKWWVDTRCDHVDKPLLKLMKEAGCVFIVYGVESGNPKVLKRIKKGITVKQIKKAFRIAKEAGIETKCNMMLGHLDETEDEMKDTIRLAKKLKATRTSFYKVIPLPGSELYDIARRRGLIKKNNFEDFTWYGNTPIVSKVSSKKLGELQNFAYKEIKNG